MHEKGRIIGQNAFFESPEDSQPRFPEDAPPSPWFLEEFPRRFGEWVAGMEEGGPRKKELEGITNLGHRVEALRVERDLSRHALAEHTGVNPDLLFFFERGLVSRTEALDALEKLQQGLKVDLSALKASLQDVSRNGASDH